MRLVIVLWLLYSAVVCAQTTHKGNVKAGETVTIKVGEKDLTPPRDRVSEAITKGELGITKPVLATKNQSEIVTMAKELGRPVIFWTFWPDNYDTTSEFFEEMSEAQHVLMTKSQLHKFNIGAGEYINYMHKDGKSRWVKASDIFGKDTASKVRAVWDGERKPASENRYASGDPDLLTRNEKREILETLVVATFAGGRQQDMTLRECINIGGKVTAEFCDAKGWSADQAAFALNLQPRQQQEVASYSTSQSYGANLPQSQQVHMPANTTYMPATRVPQQATYQAQPRYEPPAQFSRPQPQMGKFDGPIRGG